MLSAFHGLSTGWRQLIASSASLSSFFRRPCPRHMRSLSLISISLDFILFPLSLSAALKNVPGSRFQSS
eukprot:m.181450 g.181450  ORF g.181450 m.181450 type:complete len:69 (-) comp15376_c1_seq2:1696-1902(-)